MIESSTARAARVRFPPFLFSAQARVLAFVFRSNFTYDHAVYFHRTEESERETWSMGEKKGNGIACVSAGKMALLESLTKTSRARDFPILFIKIIKEKKSY